MTDPIGRELLRKLGVVLIEDRRTALSKGEREALRHDAIRVQVSRQLRVKVFGSALFAEAGWDILLALYVLEEHDPPRLDATELAELILSPITTTNRWLAYLEEAGLIFRIGSESGEVSAASELTHKGRRLLDRYLSELRESEIFGPVADTSQ